MERLIKNLLNTAARKVQGIDLTDDGRSVQLFCPDIECYFKKRLPIYVVDEDLYENTPTFILGTVDKFARLMFDLTPDQYLALMKMVIK